MSGPWTFEVPKWCPPSLNPYVGAHFRKVDRLKRQLADLLGVYALLAGVRRVDYLYRPLRHVRLSVVGWQGRTIPDTDNVLKLFLDSARRCGLIVDDSQEWCRWDVPVLTRGEPDLTTVTITDLELRPACAPEDDPYTRSLLAAATRRPKERTPSDATKAKGARPPSGRARTPSPRNGP